MGKRLSVRPQGGLRAQAQAMSATKWPMPQAQGEAQDAAEARYAKRSGADWQDAPETRGRAKRQTRGDLLQVSRHGERRARQRVGLPKKSVERNAQRALTEGIGYREASGALRRYISWLYELYDGNGNNIRIYWDKVWIFHDSILITVLNVPGEHRKAAKWQMEKRRNEHG